MQHNYQYLQKLLTTLVSDLDVSDWSPTQLELTIPTHQTFGDYTSNIALKIWKKTTKKSYQSATECAKDLIEEVSKRDQEGRVHKAELAGPGFINFWIKPEFLIKSDQMSIQLDPTEVNKKILVEFLSPNTNKQLHIGHVLNGVIGNAVINILRAAGYTVDGGTHSNDRGIHIMKSMYGYLRLASKNNVTVTEDGISSTLNSTKDYRTLLNQWINNPDQWVKPEELRMKSDHVIGWCYAKGNEIGENDEEAQSQMQSMLRAWEAGDPEVRALWSQLNAWFYEGYYETLRKLGIQVSHNDHAMFDYMSYESETYKNGKDIIINNIGNGLIQEFEDGHIEAVLENTHNIPNIVLLRKDKTALYITQDIELLRSRLKDSKYDQVIYVVDYRQTLQFKQLFIIVESLGIPEAKNCLHLAYGEVRTPQGAMSSRKGNIISADWLIDETEKRALAKINAERADYSEDEKKHIAHQVALAAIKYGMLKYNPTSNIVFDIDTNIAFEGDTGPYLQYTTARCASVLNKANQSLEIINGSNSILCTTELEMECNILRLVEKFQVIAANAATAKTPNTVCEYIYDVAQKYNQLYAERPILHETDKNIRNIRLLLTYKVKHTISSGLQLLGINALERM